jgi:uracil-DNA glycosylase
MTTPATMNVRDMFNGVDSKWIKFVTSPTLKPLLSNVLVALSALPIESITPPPCDIFNFLRYTPFDSVKIVIMGQDPYPKKGDAHGLAFSSMATTIPASLRNIFACLESSGLTAPRSANLTHWATQGVLLMNASLTTTIGVSNAHTNIWREFVSEFIKQYSNIRGVIPDGATSDGVVRAPLMFFLWGKDAESKKSFIHNGCVVYVWGHPSPLAQARMKFVDCDHFTRANALLTQNGQAPINWGGVDVGEVKSVAITVFTDGACTGNGTASANAGYASYFPQGLMDSRAYVIYGKVETVDVGGSKVYGTSQRGEGLGMMYALEEIISHATEKKIKVDVTIITDSEFWKKMIEVYMPGWVAKGIDFASKKNVDISTRVYAAVTHIQSQGKLTVEHVPSHNKDPNISPAYIRGNEIADTYAVKGKLLSHFIQQRVYV